MPWDPFPGVLTVTVADASGGDIWGQVKGLEAISDQVQSSTTLPERPDRMAAKPS